MKSKKNDCSLSSYLGFQPYRFQTGQPLQSQVPAPQNLSLNSSRGRSVSPIGSVSLETPDQYKLRGGLELMFFCLSHSVWG